MNQLSSIKERLKNINETEFQELCDCFLSLRNRDYKAFSRTGAHEVKQKTTRGTPDSFIQLPNGLYLFVESTTTEHKGRRLLDKLKGDISGCLNINKTKIPINKIQGIILCYNTNLKASEIEEVNKETLSLMGKKPMHYGLDALATEIFFHHKNLAYDFLSLPLDTGQVVSLDKFLEEYDNGKQKLATPLGGLFLHREKELENVLEKLALGDIVILSGTAGVGKSKLALESINQFSLLNLDYNSYAISPKGADLLGDLSAYFDGDENSILLVDDVNRVDKFEQILSFYRGLKQGKLKLVLTVRDYALENVKEWLNDYKKSIIKIGKLDYEEIKGIIEQEPFKILNWKYQYKINSISKGNARLAVMMAIVAKQTNKLDSLNNVTDLFEQYFETFIKDDNIFKDKQVLKTLGIISFFYTLPYNDNELLNSIANSFLMSNDELREAFDKLHSLDLIELNFQNVRVGEQNLSTYFFYKVFIKDQLLSFESLWNNYFELQGYRFEDIIYSVYQNFGKKDILRKVKPVFLSYWLIIQLNEKKAFNFFSFAWKFLPEECLIYIETRINIYPYSDSTEFKTEYINSDFGSTNSQEKHLRLLANFLKEPIFLSDALELSFRFISKNSNHLPQLIYHLDTNMYFLDEDYVNHFERYTIIVDYLIKEAEKGKLYAVAFFALSKKILEKLHWTYDNEKDKEADSQNITSIKKSRGKILSFLCDLYSKYPEEVLEVMLDFSTGYKERNKYILAFDLVYLIPWIDNNMDSNDFRHCYYVQEMIHSSTRKKFKNVDFKRLKGIFKHPTYSLFELVSWDRHRGKDDHKFKKHKEFEKLKTADITEKLTFESQDKIEHFIVQYQEISQWSEIKLYSQQRLADIIIEVNLKANIEIGFLTFLEFVKFQNQGIFTSDLYITSKSIDRITIYKKLAERFWLLIEKEILNKIWKLRLLESLPIEFVSKKHFSRLFDTLNEIKRDFQIHFNSIKKYERIDSKVLPKILEIVIKKIERENIKIYLDEEFLIYVCDIIEDIEILKKAYLQQEEQISYFDSEGKVLLKILKREEAFLLEYVKSVSSENKRLRVIDHKELKIVWQLSSLEKILDKVIEYLAKEDGYYSYSEDFANAFFQELPINEERVDRYLLELIRKYKDQPKIIDIAFNVIDSSRKILFEKAFIIYILENQELECFRKINWMSEGRLISGKVILGELRANKWKVLSKLVEGAKMGMKTLAIRNHIKNRIDTELLNAEYERRRKYSRSF